MTKVQFPHKSSSGRLEPWPSIIKVPSKQRPLDHRAGAKRLKKKHNLSNDVTDGLNLVDCSSSFLRFFAKILRKIGAKKFDKILKIRLELSSFKIRIEIRAETDDENILEIFNNIVWYY